MRLASSEHLGFDRCGALGKNGFDKMPAPGRPSPSPPGRAVLASRRGLGRTRPSRVAWLGAVVTLAGGVAARPVLHEYIELGPGQGLVEPALGSGATDISPRSGAEGRSEPGGEAQAEPGASGALPGARFSIDRDTTRPAQVSYSDPFTPTVVPFKRSVVYDTVNRDAELLVRDTTLTPVPRLKAAGPSDEHFHASLLLDLRAGERSAIPSVAPGSRLVVAHAEPRLPLRIGFDSAENWFVEAGRSARVSLTLQVVADRRAFGSSLGDPGWAELARRLPAVPAEVKRSALEVARALGVDEAARPAAAVRHLVQHFRRFTPSERRPQGQGLALYRELALTARGICRHRAYAFMITALGLGIPARLALNEAHAWVEVFDGQLWHRIDLGGAAERLDMDDEGRPRHVEPSDPFAWPDRDESGLAMVERRVSEPEAAGPAGAESAEPEPGRDPSRSDSRLPSPLTAPPGQDPNQPQSAPELADFPEPTPGSSAPLSPSSPPAPEQLAPESVRLHTGASKAERGKGLFVSGQVQNEGRVCRGASVEIELQQPRGDAIALGTLVSDANGEFRGHLVVPFRASLGEHSLVARATGRCARR